MHGLLRRPALPIDGCAGHLFGQTGGKPARAGDVTRLRADGVDAAEHDIVDGQRVEKRGLTFKRTPDKPFLKDRLFVTPTWMEVTFDDSDYTKLFPNVADYQSQFLKLWGK